MENSAAHAIEHGAQNVAACRQDTCQVLGWNFLGTL